jgi:hypothetical protein
MLAKPRLRLQPDAAVRNPVDPEILGAAALATVAAGGTVWALLRRKAAGGGASSGGSSTGKKIFGDTPPNWGGYYMGGAHKGRGLGNWQSDNAWDIFAKPGTPVYSLSSGVVQFVVEGDPNAKSVVYGDRVQVHSTDGSPDFYYTHVEMVVKRGQPIKVGELIGHIMAHPNMPKMPPHVHIGIDKGAHIKEFVAEDGSLRVKSVA